MNIFNSERTEYYKAKKRELIRQQESSRVVQEDALFIKFYGMSAYLELFPEAKGFGISWHREVVRSLKNMENEKLAQELVGFQGAYASVKSPKGFRAFKRLIKDISRSR